jgi:CRP-like cAMP-binding protein
VQRLLASYGLATTTNRRQAMDTKAKAIRRLGLFSDCTLGEIRWIAEHADEIDLPAGRTLARDGDTAREFVVLIDGVCSVCRDDDEVLLGPGSYYGEDGLMSDEARHGTVTTRTCTRVLVFGVAAFRGLMRRVPAVRQALLRDLGERVLQTDYESLSLRAVS